MGLAWGADDGEAPAPEVFEWEGCSLEFTPPPGWGRQRLQTSLEGVSFRISRRPPGVIDVGTYRLLHRTHTVRSPATGDERSFEPPPADFTLDDVVDRVFFDPGSLPPGSGVVVQPAVARTVNGMAALAVDYSWNDRGHALQCREVYFVAEACLFVARVSGTESDLELFERVLATMRYPAPAQ